MFRRWRRGSASQPNFEEYNIGVIDTGRGDALRVASRRNALRVFAGLFTRSAFAVGGISLGTGLAAQRARAATWPTRPIRFIVPFPPAGSTDILAREIALKLQDALGQAVIVDNRPGAGGSIGSAEAARASADGYTLLMGHIGTLAVNPSLYPKLAYDPRTSFTPVALIARVPNVLVVNPQLPAKDIRELIMLAKARPGELHYASGGNGSAAHLAMEYFKLRADVDIGHVPYRGTAPAVTDVLAGQVEMIMTGVPAVQQQVKAGKLRALGVSSRAPVASMAGVPTIAATLPDFEAIQWYGIVAPAGTAGEVILRLNAEINRSLGTEQLRTRLEAEGAEAAPDSPAAFGALINSEIARWKPVVDRANMRPE
jgi:tripartite-type tricarboxylate transporter receptor subunit TctC